MLKPPYLWVLLLITGAYLLLESAYNVTLLDVAGSATETDAVGKAEFWGRTISGLALAILVIGTCILPALKTRYSQAPALTWVICAFIGAVLIFGVYVGEKTLINTIVEKSSPDVRRTSYLAANMLNLIRLDKAEFNGLLLNSRNIDTPEGKAAITLFRPLIVFKPEAAVSPDNNIDAIALATARSIIGNSKEYKLGPFDRSLENLRELHKSYLRIIQNAENKRAGLRIKAMVAWNKYINHLAEIRMNPSRTQGRSADIIRKDLRKNGVNVPYGWRLDDKSGFRKAVINEGSMQIDNEVGDSLAKIGLPQDLPMNLKQFSDFIINPLIQKQWRSALGMPEGVDLRADYDHRTFTRRIYDPLLLEQKAKQLAKFESPVVEFENSGPLSAEGKNAVRAIIGPALALCLSMLGAMIHLGRTFFFAARYSASFIMSRSKAPVTVSNARRPLWTCRIIALLLLLAVAALPMFSLGPSTASWSLVATNTYSTSMKRIKEERPTIGFMVDWAVRAQAWAYPVNDAVRELVFWGWRFGTNYPAETRTAGKMDENIRDS
jgi:hypothetical protein